MALSFIRAEEREERREKREERREKREERRIEVPPTKQMTRKSAWNLVRFFASTAI